MHKVTWSVKFSSKSDEACPVNKCENGGKWNITWIPLFPWCSCKSQMDRVKIWYKASPAPFQDGAIKSKTDSMHQVTWSVKISSKSVEVCSVYSRNWKNRREIPPSSWKKGAIFKKKGGIFSSPEHKVLMVSFCDCPMAVVCRASSTISLNIFSS